MFDSPSTILKRSTLVFLVLQERLGVSRHDLWALARNRCLNVGETTAALIGQCLDWVVAMSIWPIYALPSSVPGFDNMRTAWLTQVRAGVPLVETALSLTRSARVEGHEGVALVQGHFYCPTYQHSRGKGKSKGHPVRSAPDTRSASPRLPIVLVPVVSIVEGKGSALRAPIPRLSITSEGLATYNDKYLMTSCNHGSDVGDVGDVGIWKTYPHPQASQDVSIGRSMTSSVLVTQYTEGTQTVRLLVLPIDKGQGSELEHREDMEPGEVFQVGDKVAFKRDSSATVHSSKIQKRKLHGVYLVIKVLVPTSYRLLVTVTWLPEVTRHKAQAKGNLW
ncbi:hypothetical protein Pmar_PMAR012988 [Perkinsus marinus ATCC 50983]|uniref:Uncharacterized protein n=1 Tax=Perkinsus marinus (strain ATCC 50983 / TXsc) TaxID=423536 RepID=C5KZD2_PERM5|nr:hypothetical protein Pmar_PMAR012988 [Perkinsus marinus ATCC 50983]EER10163.1 hypothetical protein Pmar_PMAR012988 [Perkinsus marinus ATCC 50983]|eukprot:XP_002778368.1 hypothetical protein Pmar_PMAR012988 [Perkinsus marinus ATCC 50983]